MFFRDLFPEDSFQDHKIAGMNLKRFRKGSDGNSDQMLKWIEEGCFDALSRKYLKSAVLTVLADTASPNNVLETYTLRVSYPDSILHQTIDATTANIAHLSLARNEKSVLAVESSPANFKEAISKILRSLCVMSQTLKTLPAKKYLSMKLSYYEEVTPKNYEPPGFVAAEFDIDHLFQGPTSKFTFGKAATPFHNIGLSMETMCDDSVRPCNANASAINSQALVFPESSKPASEPSSASNSPTECPQSTMDVQEGMNFNESIMIASQVAQASNSPPKFPQSQLPAPATVPAPAPTPITAAINNMSDTQQQLQRIKCTCGYNVKDLEMLQCNICLFWQHSVCSGYVSCRDRRLENGAYSCYYCAYGNQISTFHFIQKLSQMRKALAVLSAEGFTSTLAFSKRLGVSLALARNLRDRLIEEKFLIQVGMKKFDIAKKDDYIKDRIKFYFNQNLEIHSGFIEAQSKDKGKVNEPRGSPKIAKIVSSSTAKDVPIEIAPDSMPFEVNEPEPINLPAVVSKPQMTPKPVSSKPASMISPPESNSKPSLKTGQNYPKKRKISIPSSKISCYMNP